MSEKECWLVSVMIGYGRSAQYLMTRHMSRREAEQLAERYMTDAEDGLWLTVDGTRVNPRFITTIRVMKAREEKECGWTSDRDM